MKVAKIKNKKEEKKEVNNQEYSIKNMLKILIILLVMFTIFYFITTFFVNNDNNNDDTNNQASVIDNEQITINQLLSRKEKEYYVIAVKESLYESKTNFVNLYKEYINSYKQKENALKFYYLDLDNALNKSVYGEKINITDEIEKLKINTEVLFKIKDGIIEKYYAGKDNILDKLSRL